MQPVKLLERPLYGLSQVDRLLLLTPGTTRRWIEGYERGGRNYPPVIRPKATGREIVTWGEFVETRLLAEYRNAGVSVNRMRPAIERLRDRLGTPYPLAHGSSFLSVAGRELLMAVQGATGLERPLHLVVARHGQIVLTDPSAQFVEAVEFGGDASDGVVERLRLIPEIKRVVVDPLRKFGMPVVRSVPTELIAEQVRAGESLAVIADMYELFLEDVEAAVRYELKRVEATAEPAA